MPWLEVPEWRAFEPYAGRMTDTPNTPDSDALAANAAAVEKLLDEQWDADLDERREAEEAADEQPVVTGEMHVVLDEVELADLMAGNNDDDEEPAPNDPVDPPEDFVDPAETPDFPMTEPATPVEPERIPAPQPYPTPTVVDHIPPTASETEAERAHRLEKESMSRQERLRRGW